MKTHTTQAPQIDNINSLASDFDLDALDEAFRPLSIDERLSRFYQMFKAEDVMMTTSFGTKSIYLLHHIFRIMPEQSIYFLDTKYHFEETYKYKELLRKVYNLKLIYLYPEKVQNELTTEEKWWINHPRMCCTANKIAPLEPYIIKHKVWISGLMAYQTEHRSRMKIFQYQGDILKFHPILDVNSDQVNDYINRYELPRHPLELCGYGSVGCTHCTKPGINREGRWIGTTQKECGIHLNYFFKKED